MSEPGPWSRLGAPAWPEETAAPSGPPRLSPLRIMQIVEIGVRILRRRWLPMFIGVAIFVAVPLILDSLATSNLQNALGTIIRVDASGRIVHQPTAEELGTLLNPGLLVLGTTLLSSL